MHLVLVQKVRKLQKIENTQAHVCYIHSHYVQRIAMYFAGVQKIFFPLVREDSEVRRESSLPPQVSPSHPHTLTPSHPRTLALSHSPHSHQVPSSPSTTPSYLIWLARPHPTLSQTSHGLLPSSSCLTNPPPHSLVTHSTVKVCVCVSERDREIEVESESVCECVFVCQLSIQSDSQSQDCPGWNGTATSTGRN